MKLYCVRHGETVFNLEGRIQGQLDSQLSPLGLKQCVAVAEALERCEIDAVFASPLSRALKTAECVADKLGLKVQLELRLMEINAGIFQGHCWTEIDVHFPDDAQRWRSQDPDYQIPTGESRRALMERTAAAFHDIRASGHKAALVVGHGGSLAAALKALLEVPAERNPFSLGNGSISSIAWERDFKLLTLNEMSHLHGLLSGDGDL